MFNFEARSYCTLQRYMRWFSILSLTKHKLLVLYEVVLFSMAKSEEMKLDDNTEFFVNGLAVITKESLWSRSASKGIKSTEVLIPFSPHNTNAISISTQWESYFRTVKRWGGRGRQSGYLCRGKSKAGLESRTMMNKLYLHLFLKIIYLFDILCKRNVRKAYCICK